MKFLTVVDVVNIVLAVPPAVAAGSNVSRPVARPLPAPAFNVSVAGVAAKLPSYRPEEVLVVATEKNSNEPVVALPLERFVRTESM